MNGRSYPAAATAVDRTSGPVLAWNVEPTQFPASTYPEMPTAAAAAVSPVVSAAAAVPPDPYGRCWQNQVDPSACFPYFGTLYGSSLPPPSYRMQPGCLSNLGQFWPPTPPPEGCVRYDGSNNLHYCPPLTPVYRHSEGLPQNMLGVQRLGHYSHLIDMNKDAGLKRLDSCLDGMQRQKVIVGAKHCKDPQQRMCSCYECNEKNAARGPTPHSVNKENISDGSRLLEQKCSEDKLKAKPCRKGRDETMYSQLRTSIAYPQHAAPAVSSYACSVDPNITRTSSSMRAPNHSEYHNLQKVDIPVSSNGCAQHDFVKPESYPSDRCTINSSLSSPKSLMPQMVHSTMKNGELLRFDTPMEKPRPKLHASTSAYEPCPCPSVQTQSSSTPHRSVDNSCCFSPPYASSRTLYHNYPENSTHNKNPNMLMMYGNGFNASPLKNVYFSYYESENFDIGSGSASRKNRSNCSKIEKVVNGNSFTSPIGTPVSSHINYSIPTKSQSNTPSVKHLRGNPCDGVALSSNSYGCVYQNACSPQFKSVNSTYVNPLKQPDISMHQIPKPGSVCIKQEKVESGDCKFQKTHHINTSRIPALPNGIISNGVLNLSTSLRCPKIEPDDQRTATNVELSNTFKLPVSSSLETSQMKYASTKTTLSSQSLKSVGISNGYFSPAMASATQLMKCQDVPSAATPPMQKLVNECTPAVPEGLCPLPQSAPCGGAELAIMSKMPTTGYEAPIQVVCRPDVQQEDTALRESRAESNSGPHRLMPEKSQMPDRHSYIAFPEESANHNLIPLKRSFTLKESIESNSLPVLESASPNQNAVPKLEIAYTKVEEKESFKSCTDKLSAEKEKSNPSKEEPTKQEDSKKGERIDVSQEFEKLLKERIQEKNHDDVSGDFNGLYVLLQGIAQQKTIDHYSVDPGHFQRSIECETKPVDIKQEVSAMEGIQSVNANDDRKKGLSLLCALAEEHFLMEFGENEQCETKSKEQKPVNLSSNYPSVKEEQMAEVRNSAGEDCKTEANETPVPTTEVHMRKRLAELQQIYKEKQKELARLKPKKARNSGSSDASSSSSGAFEGTCKPENPDRVLSCSRENVSSLEENVSDMPALEVEGKEMLVEATAENIAQKVTDDIANKALASENPVTLENPLHPSSETENIVYSSAKDVMKKHLKSLRRLNRRSLQRKRSIHSSSNQRSHSNQQRKRALRNATMKKLDQVEAFINQDSKNELRKRKKLLKRKDLTLRKEFSEPLCIKTEPIEDLDFLPAQFSVNSSRSPKKRKAENPKKFMPAKQVRLTETLVTKQLRNRILFEGPECYSDEKPYDVPETLFDALRKCNLDENNHTTEEASEDRQVESPAMPELQASIEPESINQAQKILHMTADYLKENQRILAIEDGLFYAGSIKDAQPNDVYSVVLDGQRGNKKHLFSQVEMLSQTILESKPISLTELPEGTRVCAYWSHQYRCLYPGTVVKAPTPSVDWSEPRVFVEFDDGDSAQIAMKNIRFLPPDMKLSDDEEMKESSSGITPLESKRSKHDAKNKKREAKEFEKSCTTDFSPNKSIDYCSNDSNAVECCESERLPCPSQKSYENESMDCLNVKESKKLQRQQLKQRSGSKSKTRGSGLSPEKSKKHKKYKDRHKHHHHHRHHHRHHRHCHHHRHCKKRKHHKRTSNVDNIINVVIPSNSIPFSNLIAKSTRSSMKDVEAQSVVGHSRKDNKHLPQSNNEVGDSKFTQEKGVNKKTTSFTLR